MKTSPPETNDASRDGLTLVAFAFAGAAAWVAGCFAIYGIACLAG